MRSRILVGLFLLGFIVFLVPQDAGARERFSLKKSDITLLAKHIYFEAGNQPLIGKIWVAFVVLNRMRHPRYPTTMQAVLFQNLTNVYEWCQFEWTCDHKPDRPDTKSETWKISYGLAKILLDETSTIKDPTHGAMHYHATWMKKYPKWSRDFRVSYIVYDHIFYTMPKHKAMAVVEDTRYGPLM